MKKMNFKMMLWLMGVLAISLTTSCKDDDDTPPTPNPSGEPAKYLITTTVKNTDGQSGSSYMQLVSDFSGKIDNSKAIQIEFATPVAVRGKDIFVMPSFMGNGNPYLYKYAYNGTSNLGTPIKLLLPPGAGAQNINIINSEKMYIPAYNIGKIFILNPKTMTKTGEIDISQYAYKDNTPEPAIGILRDGLYYVCLDQINNEWKVYQDYHQVDVLIIDPKTDKVLKIISEKTSNLSFPTRPMDFTKGMIFTNEQNDIYIACTGDFGFTPTYKNTGFVCIPAGQKDFDTSKSWDISNTIIEGTSYKPSSIYNCQYIGNGKLVAYVAIFELINPQEPYTTRNSMAVLIDLNSKTIKQIKDIPLTDGHSVCIEKYKNLVIIGSYGKDKIGFFSYNPKTEEVKHELTTVGNPASFHYFK